MGNDSTSVEKHVFRATSLKDLTLLAQKPKRQCRSLDRLPSSVSDCFEKSTFLGRCHNRLLIFFGRGSRYKMKPCGRNLSKPKKSAGDCHTADHNFKSPNFDSQKISPTIKAKSASSPNKPQRLVNGRYPKGPTKTVWNSHEEEILSEQYASLRQMAKCRKSSARLKKIRESLMRKTKTIRVGPPSVEQEEMRNFLVDIGFMQYYPNFNRHGYDLATASHMDVMDLVALGVRDPLHRMALKYELDQVKRKDNFLIQLHHTTLSWLESLQLAEYVDNFQQNGIYSPLSAVHLNRRDLHVMGIFMLGHRKKILLSLAQLKKSISNKDIF